MKVKYVIKYERGKSEFVLDKKGPRYVLTSWLGISNKDEWCISTAHQLTRLNSIIIRLNQTNNSAVYSLF